ncbi:MAG: TetR/AcrR family transcriptional regulator [Flavobacteriaceae bacterium]|nr:TetR/AcrR family transcriptional regulator [Eudoraea sp.]NNJ38456.1 TetR/AcrR family transcriptional regulator [Flavobacteriaceae bacterium]
MKGQILEKATELFLDLGFKSVTMDDLAHEMAISKKTIYTHFKNKNQLVKACTMHVFDHIAQGIDHICSLNKNPVEELYEIKRFVMQHLKDEKSSPEFQLQKYYPQIHKTLNDKKYEMMRECVINNVKEGIAMGIYRENLDPEFIARIYFSGVTSLKDQRLFPSTKYTSTQLMDDYLEYHLRGIVTPKGRNILNAIINSNHE